MWVQGKLDKGHLVNQTIVKQKLMEIELKNAAKLVPLKKPTYLESGYFIKYIRQECYKLGMQPFILPKNTLLLRK